MKKNHAQKFNETESTNQPSDVYQTWEQLDLFEWAALTDESCVGFAVRNGF